jgi:hypothetical protein
MRHLRSEKGQAAVETAIVMPLNLFLLLSVIQFGLISQARYMAKYAAYRAVRVGTMNNASMSKMEAAAKAALLPILAMPALAGPGQEVIQPTTDVSSIGIKAGRLIANNIIPPGLKMVKVVVCGPLQDDVTNITEQRLTGKGSRNQVDFDDPRATLDLPGQTMGEAQLKSFLATKLRVQVQLNYRMPIPFANWIISRAYLAMAMPEVLRMGARSPLGTSVGQLFVANQMGIYIAPIFESYAMRMQSNYYLSKNDTKLPSTNECVSWAKPNPNK